MRIKYLIFVLLLLNTSCRKSDFTDFLNKIKNIGKSKSKPAQTASPTSPNSSSTEKNDTSTSSAENTSTSTVNQDFISTDFNPLFNFFNVSVVNANSSQIESFYIDQIEYNAIPDVIINNLKLKGVNPLMDNSSKHFAYIKNNNIYLVKNFINMTNEIIEDSEYAITKYDPEKTEIKNLSWSPNSSSIAFSYLDLSIPDNSLSIIKMIDLDTKKTTDYSNKIFSFTWPSWSPDGKQIIYVKTQVKNIIANTYTCTKNCVDLYDLVSKETIEILKPYHGDTFYSEISAPRFSANGKIISMSYFSQRYNSESTEGVSGVMWYSVILGTLEKVEYRDTLASGRVVSACVLNETHFLSLDDNGDIYLKEKGDIFEEKIKLIKSQVDYTKGMSCATKQNPFLNDWVIFTQAFPSIASDGVNADYTDLAGDDKGTIGLNVKSVEECISICKEKKCDMLFYVSDIFGPADNYNCKISKAITGRRIQIGPGINSFHVYCKKNLCYKF